MLFAGVYGRLSEVWLRFEVGDPNQADSFFANLPTMRELQEDWKELDISNCWGPVSSRSKGDASNCTARVPPGGK